MTSEQLTTAAELLGLLIVAVTLIFLVTRIRQSIAYRSAIGLALGAALILVWINLAVGIIGDSDNPANLMYVGVLAIGFVGTLIVRFQPQGMGYVLFMMALAHTLVVLIVLGAKLGVPAKPEPGVIVMLNGFFIAMWIGSGLLFRKAATTSSGRK